MCVYEEEKNRPKELFDHLIEKLKSLKFSNALFN